MGLYYVSVWPRKKKLNMKTTKKLNMQTAARQHRTTELSYNLCSHQSSKPNHNLYSNWSRTVKAWSMSISSTSDSEWTRESKLLLPKPITPEAQF